MRSYYLKIFVVVLGVIVFSLVFVKSLNQEGISLIEGKNNLYINNSFPVYASNLIKLNPLIEVVSHNVGNETIGFVNFYGGVGKDFVIQEGFYEIIVSHNTTLIFPEYG
ncbi:MAG TPA: hypothetical protein VJH92_04155 [Candidatus Nanoarchaeia archaeon]|nr:hypothetical protein [Candidatus Nanoarchaeia archaeon]